MPKKSDQQKRDRSELMNKLGFGAMPGMPTMGGMTYEDDDDEDLEAELAALAGEDYTPPPRKAKAKKKAPLAMSEIERMAAAGMADYDEDVSDTEDPDLLAELKELEGDDDSSDPPSPKRFSPSKAAPTPTATTTTTPSPLPTRPVPSPAPRPSPTQPSPTHRPAPTPPAPVARPAPAPTPVVRPAPAPTPSAAPRPSGAGGLVGTLEERVNMYKQASAQAKATGDGAKQRRMDRGLKTLVGQLRLAKAGKPVSEEEIPPAVYVATSDSAGSAPSTSSGASSASTPSPSAPAPPTAPFQGQSSKPPASVASTSNTESSKLALATRRDEYKKAALMAKRGGDLPKAGSYVKVAKQFDMMIQAIDEGKTVDLSKMPPTPPELSGGAVSHQTHQNPQPAVSVQRSAVQGAGGGPKEEEEQEPPQSSLDAARALFGAPEAPSTVMEALTQRHAKYKEAEATAKAAGEGSKVRRMGRIAKQYEDAIKCIKAGRPVDFDELPTPPGFGPIPMGNSSSASSPAPRPPSATTASPSKPAPAPAPTHAAHAHAHAPPHPSAATSHASPQAAAAAVARPSPQAGGSKPAPAQRQSMTKRGTSRSDQQMAFLKERIGEFKEAAMKAKKNHDLELAKKYVRMMKGIEPMVEALECGLPVDLSQVPPSPNESEETDFIVVNAEDCTPTGDREEVFKSLQEDLIRQIRTSVSNSQHYQKLGDIPTTAKFQKLEQNSRKDLEALKSAYRHGDPAPRFHYEMRTFSMVQCNTDLGDADMEVTIERGIQYNLPSGYSEKDMDTSVKYEMAYPNESPQGGATPTVKDTVNPEYGETFKLEISRASKSFFRFVERKSLKLEVYMKRGFFKGDKLLGTVNVKLQPLESKCTVHDSYDLMDGRKAAGGKLEVKIRIRDPFKSKQVEEVKEKWLVIDQFIRTVGSKSQDDSKAAKADSGGTICMEVLRFERQTLDKQIAQLKDSLSVTQTQNLRQRSALLLEKIELQQKKLREGGLPAWKVYLATIEREADVFSQEARQQVRIGETKKAELYMTKKKHADKEIAAIRAKIPSAD